MSASYERYMEHLRSQQAEHVTTPVTIAHCHVSDGAIYQAANRCPDFGYNENGANWEAHLSQIAKDME